MTRRITLGLLAAGFLVACNRTPTAPTGVPLSASQAEHGSAPSLEWSPTTSSGTYDYGTVLDPVSPSSVTFTLTNTGGRSSGTVTASLSTSSVYSITADGCAGEALGPNESCTVTVEFAPTGNGPFDATLTADAEHGSASLDLTGAGGPHLVILDPATYNWTYDKLTVYTYQFSNEVLEGATSPTVTLTIKNDGTATTGSLHTVSAFVNVSNDHCDASTLAPGDSCSFDVSITMPATGYPEGKLYKGEVDFTGATADPAEYLTLNVGAVSAGSSGP